MLWFEHQLNTFIEWYGRQLVWVLRHKLIFTGIVLLLFVMTLGIMKQGIIGKEMMSTGDQGKFRLNLEFDKTITVQQNNIVSQQIENYILQQPEVSTLFSNIAGPSTGIGSLGVGATNKSEFTIQLKSEKERSLKTEEFMKHLLKQLRTDFRESISQWLSIGLLPTRSSNQNNIERRRYRFGNENFARTEIGNRNNTWSR